MSDFQTPSATRLTPSQIDQSGYATTCPLCLCVVPDWLTSLTKVDYRDMHTIMVSESFPNGTVVERLLWALHSFKDLLFINLHRVFYRKQKYSVCLY